MTHSHWPAGWNPAAEPRNDEPHLTRRSSVIGDPDWNELVEEQQLNRRHTLESHEKEHPNCSDPDCEFHHPEVREDFDDSGNMDEVKKYLVCLDCGEAFEATAEGVMFAEAHETDCYGSSYIIQDESEAL